MNRKLWLLWLGFAMAVGMSEIFNTLDKGILYLGVVIIVLEWSRNNK